MDTWKKTHRKFLEKMNELVALGKKKKSVLDVQEINDFFHRYGTGLQNRWRKYLTIWKQTISMYCASAEMTMDDMMLDIDDDHIR